jgi:hypothetical protein
LLTGLFLGLVVGLLISWVISPTQYVDTTPASLRSDFKDEYRYMIAAAYAVNDNIERARARLALLKDPDSVSVLGEQTQRMLGKNASAESVQPLAGLVEALLATPTATAAPIATNTPTAIPPTPIPPTQEIGPTLQISPLPPTQTDTPSPTFTPSPVFTSTPEDTPLPPPTPFSSPIPRPTATATLPPSAPFQLTSQAAFCESNQPSLLQVFLKNSSGEPAAGIELVITWNGGEEHFFTGLKPELGNGYADFVMVPNLEYALSASGGGTRVTELVSAPCQASDGSSYPGGIRLEFKQP